MIEPADLPAPAAALPSDRAPIPDAPDDPDAGTQLQDQVPLPPGLRQYHAPATCTGTRARRSHYRAADGGCAFGKRSAPSRPLSDDRGPRNRPAPQPLPALARHRPT